MTITDRQLDAARFRILHHQHWRCHRCHQPISPLTRWPHPRSGTLEWLGDDPHATHLACHQNEPRR